jgi:hypothetical protein
MPQEYHSFEVTVRAATFDEAMRVMAERLGHDEDYGFEYQIVEWEAVDVPLIAAESS